MKAKHKKVLSLALSAALVFTGLSPATPVEASTDAVTITSMDYSNSEGGTINLDAGDGTGITFPTFNSGDNVFVDISGDLEVTVDVDGIWVDIDKASSYVYNSNWGHFWDGPGGFWFNPVNESFTFRLSSRNNSEVELIYNFIVSEVEAKTITSMTADSTTSSVFPAGNTSFTMPTFNGGDATYKEVSDDLDYYLVNSDGSTTPLSNTTDSGWIYDSNWGIYTYGDGAGVWFNPVTETTTIRVIAKSDSSIYVDYTLEVVEPSRDNYTLTPKDGTTTFTAGDDGSIGMVFPLIGGVDTYLADVSNLTVEILVDGEWLDLSSGESGFYYALNGYDSTSSKTQWSHWYDYLIGAWFQPIQEDMTLRIGYSEDGTVNGAINDNYVVYEFIGNPDAYRPEDLIMENIELATSSNPELEGWTMVLQDEFSGNKLDTDLWNYEIGYYLSDDPGTYGWGNKELQHYTDSEDNVYVSDGTLKIETFEDPKVWPEIDPDREAPYSSGRITTKDNFKFTYGRIDFSIKLPAEDGMWPAAWMMPNDDVYGGWASSGEIDVMEAMGSNPYGTSGAIHFGGSWPYNTYLHGDQTFADGGRFDDGFHVYSVVWEEDYITWYVDGIPFNKISKEQWYTTSTEAADGFVMSDGAPFDQDFFVILNLAVGGWFDADAVIDPESFPATMEVDYVRAYQLDGDVTADTYFSTLGVTSDDDIIDDDDDIIDDDDDIIDDDDDIIDDDDDIIDDDDDIIDDDDDIIDDDDNSIDDDDDIIDSDDDIIDDDDDSIGDDDDSNLSTPATGDPTNTLPFITLFTSLIMLAYITNKKRST